MITVSEMSLTLSGRKLYEDVNLKFTPGNCYGVIGANGAGKSTFLKLLEGKLQPSSGHISMGPNERMSSLNQDHYAFEEFEVLETVIQGHKKLYEVMQAKDALYAKADFTEEDGMKAADLEAEFAEMNGWDAESEAAQLLQALGIDESLHHVKMSELMEGQKIKVLLGQALFGKPDILLLDEPTNGLDSASVEWLEDFLADFPNIVIVVSHDRYFLNQVCTMMCDVDFGRIKTFVGNYDFWLESSKLAAKLQSNVNAKKEEQIKELQDFIARFSANASKSKQATSRKKQLEKITLEDIQPSSRQYPFIKFDFERELGNDLLRVENVSKTIDGVKVLDNISFSVKPDEKAAIVSRNDVATAVLMQILAGEVQPDAGTVTWGVTSQQSYLPRDTNSAFNDDQLIILDWLRQFAAKGEDDNTFLRGFLGKMLFSGDEVTKEINVLSGGEKVRCILSKIMLQKSNTLLLDDPTNHLDLESITSLNDALIDFKGALVFTSHDHQFIQTIADHIIEVSANGVVERAETNYDEFLAHPELQKQVKNLYV
ncbi:ATP-binding cassette domain-containing protein [Latilactobacillus curvatus]|uniref:ABC-F family ATPase n=1 Tax=Latilactobacillus curvatus TaxID=28038 RepID=A0ABN6GIG5_LATCU|nr:ATP-binding cassette domain-containing protein [Latilactobacillus curvatus]MDT3393465.1 ATP-binding cassette domain-containing protein [Bacillota bacterium]ANJ68610.1 ABC-F family ATPase [Latilactobacillus curvatus]MDG2979696.1 ATP-binding cassette domain-containing protein [Latilactobacillus curvatus]QAR36350.1 ATP-binding cassette domain-containing protein [Latilactobacillus curvatus]QEA48998.1 ATP-binding cassette domain-containing protein [Latilactobacillus curvatus]